MSSAAVRAEKTHFRLRAEAIPIPEEHRTWITDDGWPCEVEEDFPYRNGSLGLMVRVRDENGKVLGTVGSVRQPPAPEGSTGSVTGIVPYRPTRHPVKSKALTPRCLRGRITRCLSGSWRIAGSWESR